MSTDPRLHEQLNFVFYIVSFIFRQPYCSLLIFSFPSANDPVTVRLYFVSSTRGRFSSLRVLVMGRLLSTECSSRLGHVSSCAQDAVPRGTFPTGIFPRQPVISLRVTLKVSRCLVPSCGTNVLLRRVCLS